MDAARLGQVGLVGQVVRLGAPGCARWALDYPVFSHENLDSCGSIRIIPTLVAE